jgi:hypothetical protein
MFVPKPWWRPGEQPPFHGGQGQISRDLPTGTAAKEDAEKLWS